MIQVNIHEAKTHLSRLIAKVLAGEEIIIAKDNIPVAKLVQFTKSKQKRKLGSAKGQIQIAADFDALLKDFEEYVPWDIYWIPMPYYGSLMTIPSWGIRQKRFSCELNHLYQLENLSYFHKDPFSRLLIAQAIAENMPILSNDMALDDYPIKRIW